MDSWNYDCFSTVWQLGFVRGHFKRTSLPVPTLTKPLCSSLFADVPVPVLINVTQFGFSIGGTASVLGARFVEGTEVTARYSFTCNTR